MAQPRRRLQSEEGWVIDTSVSGGVTEGGQPPSTARPKGVCGGGGGGGWTAASGRLCGVGARAGHVLSLRGVGAPGKGSWETQLAPGATGHSDSAERGRGPRPDLRWGAHSGATMWRGYWSHE